MNRREAITTAIAAVAGAALPSLPAVGCDVSNPTVQMLAVSSDIFITIPLQIVGLWYKATKIDAKTWRISRLT